MLWIILWRFCLIPQVVDLYVGANKVFCGGGVGDWQQVAERAEARFGDLVKSARKIGFVVGSPDEAFEAVVFGRNHSLDFLILDGARLSDGLSEALGEAGYSLFFVSDLRFEDSGKESDVELGRVSVLTSGTTGVPKIISHSWETLNTFQRVTEKGKSLAKNVWACPYQSGTYAWYQMICLSLFNENQGLFQIDMQGDLEEQFSQMVEMGVSAVSATPTFWRYVLMTVSSESVNKLLLKQLSLGGEVVDQAILDKLKAVYPDSRITHIYASTEAGASIVVNDGLAGFPQSWLDGEKLKVEDENLYVKSRFSAIFSKSGVLEWVDTTDRTKIEDGRVYILGRDSEKMINVGGQKAYPRDIESVILAHPSVQWCSVTAKRAPLMGHIAIASVVADSVLTEKEMIEFCDQSLPEYAIPRLWTFLDQIPMSSNMKTLK